MTGNRGTFTASFQIGDNSFGTLTLCDIGKVRGVKFLFWQLSTEWSTCI
jgi:hypothetical protein